MRKIIVFFSLALVMLSNLSLALDIGNYDQIYSKQIKDWEVSSEYYKDFGFYLHTMLTVSEDASNVLALYHEAEKSCQAFPVELTIISPSKLALPANPKIEIMAENTKISVKALVEANESPEASVYVLYLSPENEQEFINSMGKAKKLAVNLPEIQKSYSFNVQGFQEAYAQAQNNCLNPK